MCIIEGCTKRAFYNFAGLKAEFCGEHRQINMINVVIKKCTFEGCITMPTYNLIGEKIPLYCVTHKLPDMIDIKHKRCIYDGCLKQPTYNLIGEKIALYCATHKLERMIDIKHKRCIYDGCITMPTYNLIGEKIALYCVTHKLEGMIDIKNKRCIHDGCFKQPLYNFENEKIALYCVTHKLDGMIDIKNKRCIHDGCFKQPVYNFENEKIALYCKIHKLEGMIDIKHKRCLTPLCYTRAQEKYRGYCFYCFVNLFPDEKNARNYKTKERATVEYILERFPDYTWIVDKKVVDGCSRRRPDLYLDLGYQVIIIEIDENQHEDYDCSCENMRIMQLSSDVDHRPLVFIRFNPDDYIKAGINITSCWANDSSGVCKVKKCKIAEWADRLKALQEQLSYWVIPENVTDKTVEVVQLFYDC